MGEKIIVMSKMEKDTVSESNPTKETKKEMKSKKELEELKQQVNQLQEEIDTEKDRNLRLFAEFENYKKRTTKERIELFKTAGQEVLQALLPVMDDFERALPQLQKSEDQNLFKGVELIYSKLQNTLKSKGLETIEVQQGDAFDAEIHDAITQIPAPSDDLKGKIVDVVERGYQLGDKIIRHPKVVVGQ